MTYLARAPMSARRARLSGRNAVASALAFALLATGTGGWVLGGTEHSRTLNTTLMAAQRTKVGSYTNSKATISITKNVTGAGTDMVTYFVADVTLTEPLALKAVFANKTYGKNITALPSTMASSVNAVFAINGDYYGFRDTGMVVRNGVAYRDSGVRQGLAINRDGTMALYDETRTTAARLVADGVWHAMSFGPGLVQNGTMLPGLDTYEFGDALNNGTTTTVQGNHPRTGIGVIGENHYVMIVVDGRSPGYSRGVTLTEFAQMFVDAGASLAYNLDGGGSATMYFNGAVINQPRNGSSAQKERVCSDILFVAK